MHRMLIMMLLGLAVPAMAETLSLTREESVQYGLAHSAKARRARLEEEVARTQMGQAGSLALPHLSLEATYRRLDELQAFTLGEESLEIGTLDNYDVTASLSQLLYAGGQVGAARRSARLLRDFADAARRTTEAGLIRDIEIAFYGVLLAKEAVTVQEASVAQLEAFAEQTRQRRENGVASEFDMLTAKVRLANAHPERIAARNRLELAKASFRSLLNHPGEVAVSGSLERDTVDLDLEDLEALALAHREEIRRSRIRMELGREDVVSARSEGIPSLRAFFNYQGANTTQFAALEDEWEWRWNAGLTLSWNIWDGDLTRQRVKQKRFEYEQTVADDEALRESVLLEVRQAYLGLVHAREAMAASGDSVVLAERALAIASTRYETGMSTYLEFTDANLALSTARLAWLQAQHDHAVSVVRVRYACGME